MVANREEWEALKRRSKERFGEGSIFGEGPLDARLVIIGEAPGRTEAEQGRPFVGQAGRLLDELLEEAGIARREVYVTNVVKVRPTRESGGRLSNRPPRAGEVREGMEILTEEIRLLSPAALILLGSVPAKALIARSFTMGKERGEWRDTELGVPALATYHPAYLLRNRASNFDELRQQAVEDLKKVRSRIG